MKISLNNKVKNFILLTLLLALFGMAGAASAADYYVATWGSDSNTGTSLDKPWQHPSYAAQQAKAGDTIYLLDGTWYDEHVVFANSGTQGNPIVMKAYNGTPTLDGQNSGTGINFGSNSYIIVDGLKITDYGPSGWNYGVVADGGNNITLTNCEVSGAGYPVHMTDIVEGTISNCDIHDSKYYNSVTLISVNRPSSYKVINNTIHDNPTIGTLGVDIFLAGTGARFDYLEIIGNKIYNGGEIAIYSHWYAGADWFYNVKIQNNIIYNTPRGIDVHRFAGNSVVQNNVLYNISGYGIWSNSDTNVDIKNNIITNNYRGIWRTAGTVTLAYNDVWNNSDNYVGISAGATDISIDPLFANPANKDFHLKSQYGRWTPTGWVYDSVTSPGIDAGDPLDDYSLEPVPNGDRINIGAFGNTQEASKSTGITITVPLSPQNLQAAIADKQVTLFWQAPVYDGGSTITSYNIYRDGLLIATVGNLLTYINTGLTNDTTYTYQVSAVNAIGEGPKSNQVSATPSLSTTVTLYPATDTSIKSGEPDLVRSSKAWLDLGRLSSQGNYRGLLYFDLSTIPSSTLINNATLTLIWEGENRNQPTTISVYRPSSVWDNTATWNSRQTGVSWTTAGGDWLDKNSVSYGTTPYSEVTYPLGSTLDANLNLTSLVQEYVSAKYPNTGFFLKANEIDNTYISFYSSEVVANRPKLTINYSGSSAPIDINQDGAVDISDLRIVALHFGEITSPPYPRYDVNTDGSVDILDLRQVAGGM